MFQITHSAWPSASFCSSLFSLSSLENHTLQFSDPLYLPLCVSFVATYQHHFIPHFHYTHMPAFFKLSSNNLSIITIVLKRKHALSHILLFFHFQFTTSKGMTELVIFHTLIFLLLPRTGSIFISFSAFLYSVCHGSQLFFRTSKTYPFFFLSSLSNSYCHAAPTALQFPHFPLLRFLPPQPNIA